MKVPNVTFVPQAIRAPVFSGNTLVRVAAKDFFETRFGNHDVTRPGDTRLESSSLWEACVNLNIAEINRILDEETVDIHAKYEPSGATIFKILCNVKNIPVELIEKILRKGANINEPNQYGETPLMAAIIVENLAVIQKLINEGANVNASSEGNYTTLMRAVEHENIDVVNLLLQAKAEVNVYSTYGNSALSLAFGSNHLEMVQLLLQAGATVDAKLWKKLLPLESFNLEMAKLLWDKLVEKPKELTFKLPNHLPNINLDPEKTEGEKRVDSLKNNLFSKLFSEPEKPFFLWTVETNLLQTIPLYQAICEDLGKALLKNPQETFLQIGLLKLFRLLAEPLSSANPAQKVDTIEWILPVPGRPNTDPKSTKELEYGHFHKVLLSWSQGQEERVLKVQYIDDETKVTPQEAQTDIHRVMLIDMESGHAIRYGKHLVTGVDLSDLGGDRSPFLYSIREIIRCLSYGSRYTSLPSPVLKYRFADKNKPTQIFKLNNTDGYPLHQIQIWKALSNLLLSEQDPKVEAWYEGVINFAKSCGISVS